jgi:hypothetical protein
MSSSTHRGGVQMGGARPRQALRYPLQGHDVAEVGSQAAASGDIHAAAMRNLSINRLLSRLPVIHHPYASTEGRLNHTYASR